MTQLVVSLPMYDWPEARSEVDAEWSRIRDQLRNAGISSPRFLTRRNGDMPPVRDGIRDAAGKLIAPDPATLSSASLDLPTLWRHPGLLFAQTCWGPLEHGLAAHVTVVAQPDYTPYEGGAGKLYASVVLAREGGTASPPPDGRAYLPLEPLRGKRFAFNGADSMSGVIALSQDLETLGASTDIFAALTVTGAHRASIQAVAAGLADICAVDCRTWKLAQRFEPGASLVRPVGWTARRKGLPYVVSNRHAHLFRGVRLDV